MNDGLAFLLIVAAVVVAAIPPSVWMAKRFPILAFPYPEPQGIPQLRRQRMKEEMAIEAEIQATGLNAPRLTPADIDAKIAAENYHVFPGTTLTVCCLVLQNGFCVTGESAAASAANFDEEIGRKIARENARQKIWPLEGYRLRQHLFETQVPGQA